jgi:multiple antibiotic resistance protein
MPSILNTFLHLLFVGVIALFPVVNPIGSAFIVSPYFSDLSDSEKRLAVRKITLYAFCICTVSLFIGHWILELFGISIPIIQLAGGIMICKMGWEFMTSDKSDGGTMPSTGEQIKHSGYQNIENKLFYPITFPVTTGPGTISVLFTLSADSAMAGVGNYYINTGAILLAIIIMCILIYIFYLNTKIIIHYLGTNGELIFNRIIAFLIFCVGLQIAVNGIKNIIK